MSLVSPFPLSDGSFICRVCVCVCSTFGPRCLQFLLSFFSSLRVCGSEMEPPQRLEVLLEALLGLRMKMVDGSTWPDGAASLRASFLSASVGLDTCYRFDGCAGDARAERSICSELV